MARMQRRMRYPSHPFNVKSRPYQITPFMIAAVLPGETLKSATMQAKALTPPLQSTTLGWWAEQYFFYVKLSDLGSDFVDMVIDPDYSPTALDTATPVTRDYFEAAVGLEGINYVDRCLEAIMPVYFRDDGEAASAGLINSEYSAKIVGKSVIDSLKPATAYEAAAVDPSVDLNANATITASEVIKAQRMYLSAMQNGLTDKSYEDWLRDYGVKIDAETRQGPELLRYLRDWTYPTRLVDPADGSPTAACQWALQERLDKPRFFKEPGFVFGVTCFRPKVYLKNWQGTLTAFMKDGSFWMPSEALNVVAEGIKAFTLATGPAGASTANYALDLRDLLMHGEQFVNHDLTTAKGTVSLPSLDGTNTKYATDADVQALFVGTTYDVEAEGVVNLRIATPLLGDMTPNA